MSMGFGVVELEKIGHVETGEHAPDFERTLVNGEYWEDITVAGLSISTHYEHVRFIDERGIEAALFSDPGNGDRFLRNRPRLRRHGRDHRTRPAVFLIDEGWTVQYAWVARERPDLPDVEDVAEAIDAL